jgi:translocation and assembly module TamB
MSAPAVQRPPRRARLRMLLWSLLVFVALALAGVAVLLYSTRTPQFESWVRQRIAARLAEAIGGHVEIREFHWRPLHLEGEAGGVTIHGLEAAGEEPYVRVDRLRTRLSILDIWSPRVLLRELEVDRPQIHLIVYADGSTNQPRPRKPVNKGKPPLDTLFDLQAGHVAVEQGALHFEDRAAQFDFQSRNQLLDFSARDVSVRMSYLGAAKNSAESYHVDAGARDLLIARGAAPRKLPPAEGYVQASLDLTRNGLKIRSLRLTSIAPSGLPGPREHTLEVSGALDGFARPRWNARVTGELDMRILDPVTGYPDTPDGMARLDLTAMGQEGQFRVDGSVHAERASYIANGVTATGVGLDAHVHADPQQLVITQIVTRLRQGGRIEGTVALSPWLAPVPGAATMGRVGESSVRAVPGSVPPAAMRAPPVDIPVNGKVTASFHDVPLDAVLDIVGQPPLQRLGLDTLLNGPAMATWTKGDTRTLMVGAKFGMNPGTHPEAGEVAASGAIDATYSDRTGAVDVRQLELNTPGGRLTANGNLGAYPVTSPTSLVVDFHSRNLRDFDTVLRNLGLRRGANAGVAALPVSLEGSVDFRGTWTGSLVDPHLNGNAQATQIAIETLARPGDPSGEAQWVHWDTIEAAGSYSAQRIDIAHGLLRRDNTDIVLSGDLVAAAGAGPATSAATGHAQRLAGVPAFNDDSTLSMRLHATHVSPDQLIPLTGRELPLTGAIETQLTLDGPIRALSGSGWVELTHGTAFGEPVERMRAQGTLASQTVTIGSAVVNVAGGAIQGKGSVHLDTRQFTLESHGSGIDLSRVAVLAQHGVQTAGKLGFNVNGSGTLDDPHLDASAVFGDLAVNGQPMGPLQLTAHAADHTATYDAATSVDAASLKLHGRTALTGDYDTHAQLDLSQFNIGALLAMAHIQRLNGESALAGTVTLDGPLERLDELHGDARLQNLAVTVAGVHLKSDTGLHASLANSHVTLDPLHITGEDTDLRAQGTLALRGQQQLDFAASGSINLKLGQMLDSDLTASGTTTFQVEGHGPMRSPGLRGRIDFQDGSLALEDVPNGLSQLHGTLEFNQDRLEVRSLTAVSGGGQLSVSGYLTYQRGLYADLRVTGKGIRIRYPTGVSSLSDGTFHLQGVQNNLLLTGNVLITRFSVSPDLDIAALAAQANAVQPVVSPDAPSNHIRLDVHITSSPQLNFQNSVAKLAGDVDLRLRGTVASPTLLGSVQITEGNALIAGTRYELQRGTVSFSNPVRIEPSIDLSATAHVSDYDITLGLHGTPSKMSVSYRSDPPLPEADVVALLALGRSSNQQRIYTEQQEQQGANPTTDALLGGALNATVSSRVQKLFGAGSVKIDPNYLGALGNSTSRIIVEEQVGRDLTLTYATNVDTTQQQLLQAEIAINRHVSLMVARDESGVFSMVVKATRRFK